MCTRIFIIGSIPKGDGERESWKDWKPEYLEKLSQIPNVEINDGDTWRDETKPLLLVGHCANHIRNCDLVIVNSENSMGVGTSQEILIAKYFSKPIISVIPKNSPHRRSDIVFDNTHIGDWIHPFLFTFSDLIIEDVSECIAWIQDYTQNPKSKTIKNIAVIDDVITSYLQEQKFSQ